MNELFDQKQNNVNYDDLQNRFKKKSFNKFEQSNLNLFGKLQQISERLDIKRRVQDLK